MSRRSLVLAIAGSALTFAMAAPTATAGEFTISACQADRGGFATGAFSDFATRGMKWRRACNPQGPGLRGLVTSNVVRSGRVGRGARSVFVLDAPPGTAFVRYRWSGHARRRDCRYSLQVYAEKPGGGAVPIKNVPANDRCPKPKHAQGAGWPKPRTYDVGGATRIVQRVVCVGGRGRRWCSSRGLNYIRTFTAQATVVDTTGPSVNVIPDNPFTRGEWVGGSQAVAYNAADNVGVRAARLAVGQLNPPGHSRPCNYAQRVPCSSGPSRLDLDLTRMVEGTQPLSVVAEDAGGNSTTSAPVTVRIDNTAPGAIAVGVEGGDGWRNLATGNDFNIAWLNPDEGDRAPITSAHYRLCPAGGGDCRTGEKAEVGVSRIDNLGVPAAGAWELRLWRGDAAGNRQPSNASVPVTLRYDPEPPTLRFEQSPPSDPTKVSVLVEDRVSGLDGGELEIGPQGSNSWQTIQATKDGDRLVAHIDDAAMAPGAYALRAVARDKAGNQTRTDPISVNLPLRTATKLEVGKAESRRVRRRKVTILRRTVRSAFGRQVRLSGRLTTRRGEPLAGAPIQVYSTVVPGSEQLIGTGSTDSRGRFAYTARAAATRSVRFVYAGSPTILPAQDRVEILTRGSSSLTVSKRRTVNGGSVVFAGRVPGRPLPAAGKLVEVQVQLTKGWQTFRTLRTTDPAGRWRQRYRFQNTCGVERFRFRARLPQETGHPFETGASRTVSVKVRGRPCP
jgi:hypothetical protein